MILRRSCSMGHRLSRMHTTLTHTRRVKVKRALGVFSGQFAHAFFGREPSPSVAPNGSATVPQRSTLEPQRPTVPPSGRTGHPGSHCSSRPRLPGTVPYRTERLSPQVL